MVVSKKRWVFLDKEKNAAMFLGGLFFIPVDISRNHGTKAYFWWCFRNQWHALHLEPSADPRKYQLTGRSSTDPAREPSLFGQCHKSWLRSAMSLSEWTVGE